MYLLTFWWWVHETDTPAQTSPCRAKTTVNKTVVFCLLCMCVSVGQAYVTSRSVLLSSWPRFWMYLHWPSWTGWPVRWMLSTVSWASSNSHCTTNTGPVGTIKGDPQVRAEPSFLALAMKQCFITDFLMLGRLYIQRNSSTPLPHEPVCSFPEPVPPSTCTNTKCHHNSVSCSSDKSHKSVVLPDASLYGLSWCTADGVQTICEFVLFVIQKPSRVGQAPDLNPCVALWLQLLCDAVHIQQDSCTARTVERMREIRRRNTALV